jgi:diphosphoinositol-polyphosphate diphosphatase
MNTSGCICVFQRTALGMWVFRSKSSPVSGDSPRGACKGYIFALEVAEELEQWPEQDTHGRQWVSNQLTNPSPSHLCSFFIHHCQS